MTAKAKTLTELVLLGALLYALYLIFPFGFFADTAEAQDGAALALQASDPAQKEKDAVVVELFTSQSCYSCPPAEALLRDLAVRPDVIALEYHVDYWDDLVYGAAGRWQDVFSSPEATMRQADYNLALRGRPGGYTPQMVVNGRFEEVGSRKPAVEKAIKKAKEMSRPRWIVPDARISPEGSITVDFSTTVPPEAEVLLLQVLRRAVTEVRAGENKGKLLASYNIVRKWKVLHPDSVGRYAKAGETFSADDTCAVLVQDRKTHALLGAAFCRKDG